eukprot:478272-Prorocentrum_minimum.AAC.1
MSQLEGSTPLGTVRGFRVSLISLPNEQKWRDGASPRAQTTDLLSVPLPVLCLCCATVPAWRSRAPPRGRAPLAPLQSPPRWWHWWRASGSNGRTPAHRRGSGEGLEGV